METSGKRAWLLACVLVLYLALAVDGQDLETRTGGGRRRRKKVSASPTVSPTRAPSDSPSDYPSVTPSVYPSLYPSAVPSDYPSISPSDVPSDQPSDQPSDVPSDVPTFVPTLFPTEYPTDVPTEYPTENPTAVPTGDPTPCPTFSPSDTPSDSPSENPSDYPSSEPSQSPTSAPSSSPSSIPTSAPSTVPTLFQGYIKLNAAAKCRRPVRVHGRNFRWNKTLTECAKFTRRRAYSYFAWNGEECMVCKDAESIHNELWDTYYFREDVPLVDYFLFSEETKCSRRLGQPATVETLHDCASEAFSNNSVYFSFLATEAERNCMLCGNHSDAEPGPRWSSFHFLFYHKIANRSKCSDPYFNYFSSASNLYACADTCAKRNGCTFFQYCADCQKTRKCKACKATRRGRKVTRTVEATDRYGVYEVDKDIFD